MKSYTNISGNQSNYSPAAIVQQVSVGSSPANNPAFARAVQLSQDVVRVVRANYGVCFPVSELVSLAITYEPNLSYAPIITTEPTAVTDSGDASVNFTTVVNSELSLTYQWKYSSDGVSYSNATGGVYSNGTTATLTVNPITGLTGYYYKCACTNAKATTNTTAVQLTVDPLITAQPPNRSIASGGSTTFTITATGTATITYQWQYNDGGGWINVVNAVYYSGATTATLTITGASVFLNGTQYRCVATNGYGPSTSSVGTLTVT